MSNEIRNSQANTSIACVSRYTSFLNSAPRNEVQRDAES
jgi:hypothetical protein